jgi:UDP:flavonoid glycosyltransferase YjiC (YdhE family)
MARVLAYSSPARGHLYPLVPILDELAGRGHETAIRTLASQVALMRDRGFAAAPISTRVEGLVHDDHQAAESPRHCSSRHESRVRPLARQSGSASLSRESSSPALALLVDQRDSGTNLRNSPSYRSGELRLFVRGISEGRFRDGLPASALTGGRHRSFLLRCGRAASRTAKNPPARAPLCLYRATSSRFELRPAKRGGRRAKPPGSGRGRGAV